MCDIQNNLKEDCEKSLKEASYESGDSSKPVIFLFPGTCCLYSSFEHVLDGLHSYFYTITVSYDGFDPNEKTEFYSMEDECEKIEQEIKKKYCGRIKAVEGDKQ